MAGKISVKKCKKKAVMLAPLPPELPQSLKDLAFTKGF